MVIEDGGSNDVRHYCMKTLYGKFVAFQIGANWHVIAIPIIYHYF